MKLLSALIDVGEFRLRRCRATAAWIGLLVAVLILVIFAGWRNSGPAPTAEHADSFIVQGRGIYADHCAACHGADLEGQPAWRSPLSNGRLPAPPHDETGHTWHHPDDVLLRIVKEGTAAVVGSGYESDMPGFDEVLSDEEISAVLAFIKSTWPNREQRYQEAVSEAK